MRIWGLGFRTLGVLGFRVLRDEGLAFGVWGFRDMGVLNTWLFFWQRELVRAFGGFRLVFMGGFFFFSWGRGLSYRRPGNKDRTM